MRKCTETAKLYRKTEPQKQLQLGEQNIHTHLIKMDVWRR